MATTKQNLNIKVEFTGGLELLFGNKRLLNICLSPTSETGDKTTVGDLIRVLLKSYIQDARRELFVQGEAIRPGVLVLINDADWELEGEEAYELQNGDDILFVSTLHGG